MRKRCRVEALGYMQNCLQIISSTTKTMICNKFEIIIFNLTQSLFISNYYSSMLDFAIYHYLFLMGV